jgi:signal transduction histidine kinase
VGPGTGWQRHERTNAMKDPGARGPGDGTREGNPAKQWSISGWKAKISSVRFRVVAAMLAMMAAGLCVAGVITFAVQFQEADARVDQALLDKAQAVIKLAETANAADPESFLKELQDAAEDIEPRGNEVMATITGGKVSWTLDGASDEKLLPKDMYQGAAALANASGAAYGDLSFEGRRLRTVVLPVPAATDAKQAYFLIGRETADQREHTISSVHTYTLVGAGTLLGAAALGSLVAGRLLNPLRRLREASQVVSHEDLTQRVEVKDGSDDVTLLAKTFNTMLERLDEGAKQQEQFLDDAGHELRTPLTILRGHLELISVHDPEDVATTRDVLLEEVDRMQRLVDDLLLLANASHPDFIRKESIRIPEFIQQVLEKVHVLADRTWTIDETADCTVEADPQRLTQALAQLAANAVRYTGSSSTIALGSRVDLAQESDEVAAPESNTLVLWVRDTGSGIAVEDQQRIFERFGRAAHGRGDKGSGLGLAIVSAIAQAHGGAATVHSTVGQGSSFIIRIPLQTADARL